MRFFTLYDLAACFLLYSFLGWCLEVVYQAVTTGKMVNRGFLNGPVCPIYGFGMLAVLLLLTPIRDNELLLFICGTLLTSAIELLGGWLLYKLYHTRWWDYSAEPFNLGGFVCLRFSLMWGVGVLLMVRVLHPLLARGIAAVPQQLGWGIMGLCYLVYAADTVVTACMAAHLARDMDALDNIAEGLRVVSDALTEALASTAMASDQKIDEQRLQLKLAAAELRSQLEDMSPTELAAKTREAVAEALAAAQGSYHAAQQAAQGAMDGTRERVGEVLALEKRLAALQELNDQLQARLRRAPVWSGYRRLYGAFPKMRRPHRFALELLQELWGEAHKAIQPGSGQQAPQGEPEDPDHTRASAPK